MEALHEGARFRLSRVAEDFFRRARFDGVAALEINHLIGDAPREIHVVRNYDERFAKDSVGTVLSILLMEHVIEVDKVKEVDYLTGDDPYKRDWMSHRRERWGIMAFNPRTLHGLLAAARHKGGHAARRLIDAARQIGRSKP